MADTVRYHTEEMVPELQDLEKRGFFSRPELKQIAHKRTDFEYLLKRRATLREDFLRYIEYEKQVEALRVARRKSRKLHGKTSLSDHAGVRRVHFIFERATRKFPSDLSFWTLWLQYCRETKSVKRVSRVLTKALQFHPTSAGLWSHAAAWELQHHGNAAAARTLMQRGLRMAKDCESLWLDYFKLELTYVQRLHARRRVLGISSGAQPSTATAADSAKDDSPATSGSDDDGTDERATGAIATEEDSFLSQAASDSDNGNETGGSFGEDVKVPAEENEAVNRAAISDTATTGADTSAGASKRSGRETAKATKMGRKKADGSADAAMHAVLSGGVASIVFQSAITAVPRKLHFRALFLAALQPFRFSGVERLEQSICDSIVADFGSQPEAVDLAARRHLADSNTAANLQAAVGVYERALQSGATSALYDLFHAFLAQQLQRLLEAAALEGAPADTGVAVLELARRLLAAYSAASEAGLASEGAYLAWPAMAKRCGKEEEALQAALAGTGAMPASPVLQCQLLVIVSDKLSSEMAAVCESASVTKLRQQLRRHVMAALHQAGSRSDSAPLWTVALESCELAALPAAQVADALVAACLTIGKGPLEGGMGDAAAAALTAVHQSSGLTAARQIWRRLAAGPAPGGALFRAAVALEADALTAGDSAADATAAIMAAEAGIRSYGQEDTQLWLQFARLVEGLRSWQGQQVSMVPKDIPSAADVAWRAQRMLVAPDQFIQLAKDL